MPESLDRFDAEVNVEVVKLQSYLVSLSGAIRRVGSWKLEWFNWRNGSIAWRIVTRIEPGELAI
jgi:hypothetical protein